MLYVIEIGGSLCQVILLLEHHVAYA